MRLRKITKIILVTVASLLTIFFALYVLIQLPPVQTYIVRQIAGSLSSALHTTVSVEKVKLKFFKTASLTNVYIEAQNGDTLLHAGKLDASISLFSLFNKTLRFNEISIFDTYLQFKRKSNDPDFNFQFIIDHFTSDEPAPGKSWSIDMSKLKISSSSIFIDDQFSGQNLFTGIGSLIIYIDRFDTDTRIIDIRQLGLGDSEVIIRQSPSEVTTTIIDSTTGFIFPKTGWTFNVDQIRLDENEILYKIERTAKTQHLNFKDLHLKNFSFFADNFHWGEAEISAKIIQTSFQDQSGFILQDLAGDLVMSPDDISVTNLHIGTPHSVINNQTRITFPDVSKGQSYSDSIYVVANFNDSKLDYQDLKLLIPDFYKIPYINTELKEKINISGTVEGYLHNFDLNQLKIGAKNLVDINLSGTIEHISNPDKLKFSLDVRQFHTSYDAIRKLTKDISISPGIAHWKDFKLSGMFKGSLDNIRGSQVRLYTGSVTQFEGDFDIKGLSHPETALFNVNVRDLRSVSEDLKGFSLNPLPPALDSLGQFYYAGTFNGTIRDFALDGRLASDAGSMNTDVKMTFNQDYTDASYSGDLMLDSFDLGKVLSIPELGHFSIDINIFGSGLNAEVLRATVLGEVQELVYNDYHYRDLLIDGRFDKRQFAGSASIDDPNIAFDFEGLVNLHDSMSRFRFRASIDTLNFKALGFLPTQLAMKGYLESDFSGSSADNMKGRILGIRLLFSNLTDEYLMDSLLLLSDFSQQNKRSLEIHSDLINGTMEGDFSLAGLAGFFRNYTNKYFPIDLRSPLNDTLSTFRNDSLWAATNFQEFNFNLDVHHGERLAGLLIPEIEKIDTIKLSGDVNSSINIIQINGYVHEIIYDGMSFGPVTITSQGDEQSFDNVVTVSNVHITDGIEFPFIHFDVGMSNDSAYIGLIMEDISDTIQEKLNLAALITADDQQYHMLLNNSMVLNGRDWQINPDHDISFKNGQFFVRNLNIKYDEQLLALSTIDLKPTDDIKSAFSIDFENFELSEVSQLLEVKDAFYDGEVNGNFTLRTLDNTVNYLADLTLNDLTLQDERIGNLVIKSQQRSKDILDVLVRLDGGISGLDIRGTYNRANSEIDIQGEIDQLEMKSLDPFLGKYITKSDGKISGRVKLGGTSSVPVVDGNFELEKISTLINYLQARYTFVNEDIEIRQNKMNFRDFTLLDQNANSATINGEIDFKLIQDPGLSLNFKTSRFLVLNTPANSKDFFYGKLFVEADVDINGSLSQPNLLVNAKALDSTDFVLQPLISEAQIRQEDFIIFANPEDYESDTSISLQDFYQSARYNFDISANIECTEDAQLTIVIDPATGDKLVCRGNGNLAIEIAPDGSPKILGNYIITEGQYAFNFQRVLKRTFEIDPGSRVDFVGDIFKSRFDISATYSVQTSTYELIRNQSTLNAAEESRSRQRSKVDVKLKLTGTLEQPNAKFDLAINDASGNGLTSSVSSKLAQLREDESGMNKQVFGLLIFNSFIAEEQTTNSSLLADASQSVILSSVSNILSNELNRLAKRYIKGVDLDFGVDSYSGRFEEGSGVVTELKVGLSKRLLNDRLTIKLGGNVQFENNDNINLVNNQNSTFSGDFILEYKLSPDGNYNLRFFQVLSNQENLFDPGVNYSETGVSLFFSKSFNSKKYQLQLDEQ